MTPMVRETAVARKPTEEGDASAVEDAGEDVAAEVVGAEEIEMLAAITGGIGGEGAKGFELGIGFIGIGNDGEVWPEKADHDHEDEEPEAEHGQLVLLEAEPGVATEGRAFLDGGRRAC